MSVCLRVKISQVFYASLPRCFSAAYLLSHDAHIYAVTASNCRVSRDFIAAFTHESRTISPTEMNRFPGYDIASPNHSLNSVENVLCSSKLIIDVERLFFSSISYRKKRSLWSR
jgi:hypothetical protein